MNATTFQVPVEKFLFSLKHADLPEARLLSPDFVRLYAKIIAEGFATNPPTPTKTEKGYEYKTEVYGVIITSNILNAVKARAKCKKFWARTIEKKSNEGRLAHEAKNKIVGKTRCKSKKSEVPAQLYCSNETLKRDIEKKRRNESSLSKHTVTNMKTKKSENLLTIVKKNEENKVSETYHIAKNLEHLAEQNNFRWLFITLTAPAKYHPNPTKGKCNYDPEISIKDSHKYIGLMWGRIKSILNKRGIPAAPNSYFGIRTVEPHKDGSMHWHILIFTSDNHLNEIIKAIREKFQTDVAATIVIGRDSKDKGCAKAASYLYKYIAKSLSKKEEKQNKQEETLDKAREAKDLATTKNKKRVQAAIKAISARQYQLIGVSNLKTMYSKINKLDLADVVTTPKSPLEFIKNNIWRNKLGFYHMLKNDGMFKKGGSVSLLTQPTNNSYGEIRQKIIGIKIGDVVISNDSIYKIEKTQQKKHS
ncbi:replication endonuclease [Pseudomonas sp. TH10]|uniref:replication endonuclease n=1 Tax=Pseudomonas sp. TH10 TaxID=2796376 RepID=UPI001914AAA3|nr:replication endonuclease [Pseudomonas sp. TH10]MBK5519757.1 replication endonuclease [Pseudomonas sp. TH10]